MSKLSELLNPKSPPNPQQTAGQQTASNVATAVANANIGNVNQVTPQGNLTYNQSGTYDFVDPTTGSHYPIPQFTATQTYTPAGQAAFDQTQQAELNLAGLANQQSGFLRNQFATPLSLEGAPAFGDPSTLTGAPQAQTTFGGQAAGAPKTEFGEAAGNIQQSYQHGDDFSADRQRVEEGLMGRLNPSLAIERNRYEQQLADQGILQGSPAYENAMRNYGMQATDARFAAIAQGGQEQQRLSDMARAAGEFANKSQQQSYEQQFGRGQFYNAGQQQGFSQAAAEGTFANAARAQNFAQAQSAFNASNAARQQKLSEIFALRNQPINEISALLSSSQVASPNFLQTSSPSIPTTDVAGLINRNFDQQMAQSNQAAATANNIIGGLFGFAGGLGRGGAFNK